MTNSKIEKMTKISTKRVAIYKIQKGQSKKVDFGARHTGRKGWRPMKGREKGCKQSNERTIGVDTKFETVKDHKWTEPKLTKML